LCPPRRAQRWCSSCPATRSFGAERGRGGAEGGGRLRPGAGLQAVQGVCRRKGGEPRRGQPSPAAFAARPPACPPTPCPPRPPPPGLLVEGDEELGAVGVGLVLVGARHEAAVAEAQARVELVLEGLPIDGLSACAGAAAGRQVIRGRAAPFTRASTQPRRAPARRCLPACPTHSCRCPSGRRPAPWAPPIAQLLPPRHPSLGPQPYPTPWPPECTPKPHRCRCPWGRRPAP
jgi:hypothetical protein